MENRMHQLAVVLKNRCLTRVERVAFSPAESKANGQRPGLCRLVDAAGIIRNIKTWDPNCSSSSGESHQRVQDRGRGLFFRLHAMAVSFKTDAIDCAIDLGSAEDLFDLICYGSLKRDVNGFATE